MTRKNVHYIILAVMLMTALAAAGCVVASGDSARQKESINNTLIGTNLTYYSFAGKPINYTITTEDITSIEPTIYDNSTAWKVHVGQGLMWDLIMDDTGTKILDMKQLFQT